MPRKKEETVEVMELYDNSPNGLISQAIAQNSDIAQLEKLMDLQERWYSRISKMHFLKAITEFQSIVPSLIKNKQVAYKETRYKYTPLGEITSIIKESMLKTGLSYRWELSEPENSIMCTCIISHIDGHSEKTSMSAQLDTSGSKNAIQSRGSTVTYLQRYTLINALGLSTADEDDDGKSAKVPQKKKVEPFNKVINSIKSYKSGELLISKCESMLDYIKENQPEKEIEIKKIIDNKLVELGEPKYYEKISKK